MQNEPLGRMIVELDLNDSSFSKNLTAVNRSIKSVEKEMKANLAVAKSMDDKYGELSKRTQGLNKIMQLNEKRIEQLNEKRRKLLETESESSEAVQRLNNEINTAVTRQNKWKQQLSTTERQMRNFKQSTKDLENEFDKLQKKTDENIKAFKKNGLTYDAAKAKLKGLSEQSEHHQKIVDKQKQNIVELTQEFGENSQEVLEAKQRYRQLVDTQNRLNDSYQDLDRRLSNISPRIGRVSNRFGQLETKLLGVSRRMKKTGETFTTAGQAMTSTFSGMALAGGAGVGYAVKKAADFEQAMTNVRSLMTTEEWAKYGKSYTDLVNKLGLDTKYSSTQVASGLEELIKAGVDLESILGGSLKSSLSLATAGELELGDAAEIAATVLNSFKDDGIDMARAADLLAGSANASATSVEEMKYSLSMVSSVAGPLGFTFEDTNNALAIFAQNGLKGSDAGTSLKTMLMRLSPQTQAAADVMAELGIASTNTTAGYKYLVEKGMKPASRTNFELEKSFRELAVQTLGAGASKAKLKKETDRLQKASGYLSSTFFDEQGNVKEMSEVFNILQESTKNLSSEQKQNAFNTMFGSDAIRGAMIASKNGAEAFDEMGVAINKISADDVAETKMDTLKGAIEKMTGEAESAATAFGTQLIPAVQFVANKLESAVGWFNGLSDSTKKWIVYGSTFAVGLTVAGAALGFISIGIGGLITGVASLIGMGGKVSSWFSRFILGINSSTLSLTSETTALDANTRALRRNNRERGLDDITGGNGGGAGGNGRRRRRNNNNNNDTDTNDNDTDTTRRRRGGRGRGARIGKFAKGAGAAGAVIGVGTLAYELSTGSGTKESIGGATGGALGGVAGGAAAGAALGSVVPVVGTAIGGIAGGIIGGIAGDKIGAAIGKGFDDKDKKEKVIKQAEKGATLNLNLKGISKDTKTALGEYNKLYEGAKNSLNQIEMSNTVINAKIKNNTVKEFTAMKNSVLSTMKTRHQEELVEARKALESNKQLTQKQKDDAIAKLKTTQQKEISSLNSNNARVKQILENASKEKRALTTAEKNEIARINNKMYDAKIKKTAKSEAEINKINKQRSKQRQDITTKEMLSTIKTAKKEYKDTVSTANKKYKEKVKYADMQYKTLGVISKKEYDKLVANAKDEKNKTISEAKKKRDSVVKRAEEQKERSVKQSKEQKEKAIKNAKGETSGIAKAWDSVTGFFTGISDWFVKLFGGSSAGKPPTYGSTTSSNKGKVISGGQSMISAYENGTVDGSHKGGTALVGEIGPELSYVPGNGYQLLGMNGPSLYDLPRGTAILPHNKTAQLLNSYNFPAYAKGTGDDNIFEKLGNYVKGGVGYLKGKAVDTYDFVSGGASSIYEKLKSAFNFNVAFPKTMDNWTPSNMGKWVGKKAIDLIEESISNFSLSGAYGGEIGPSGGSASSWSSKIQQAASEFGISLSARELQGIIAQIHRESGGNQNIVQSSAVWDVNTANGNPARGLLQYIPQTFAAYKLRGHENIYNGYDQLLAFFNNANWRRDLPYGKSGWGPSGKRIKGYKNGGIITKEQLAMIGEGDKKEVVIPLQPSGGGRSRALDLLAYAAENLLGKGSASTASTVEGNNVDISALVKQNEQMINLLSQLVSKNNDVYLDSKIIKKGQDALIKKENKITKFSRGSL